MKVKIKDNASELYLAYARSHNYKYMEVLRLMEGNWFDVDENFLLPHSYFLKDKMFGNMSVHQYMVAEVENDARLGKYRCSVCGGIQDSAVNCLRCGKANLSVLVK